MFFCVLMPEINSWWKNIVVSVVKNECVNPDHRTFKLAICHKGIIGANWFFAWWYKFRIANNHWVGMVKRCWGPFLVMGLQHLLYCKNNCMNWADFMHANANSGKLKITLIIFVWSWSKMGMGEWMNLADFLHAYTYSGKSKVT